MTDRERLIKIARIVSHLSIFTLDGELAPRKNTSRKDCYKALVKVQELVKDIDREEELRELELLRARHRYNRQVWDISPFVKGVLKALKELEDEVHNTHTAEK